MVIHGNSRENVALIVNRFYGIGDWDCNLGHVVDTYKHQLGEDYIPICDDPGGNEFIIGVCGSPDEGQVFFWPHDNFFDDGKDKYFIAGSFNEFFDGLTEEEAE